MIIYDAIIIGGGVIGLSTLRSSLLAGYNTILIERNPHLCNGASGRNLGILCTGVDAPYGSLERALIRDDSIPNVRECCLVHNVPMRECGSLVCSWPWDDIDDDVDAGEKKLDDSQIARSGNSHARLQHVLYESHIAGDKDAAYLSSDKVAQLDPSLITECRMQRSCTYTR